MCYLPMLLNKNLKMQKQDKFYDALLQYGTKLVATIFTFLVAILLHWKQLAVKMCMVYLVFVKEIKKMIGS